MKDQNTIRTGNVIFFIFFLLLSIFIFSAAAHAFLPVPDEGSTEGTGDYTPIFGGGSGSDASDEIPESPELQFTLTGRISQQEMEENVFPISFDPTGKTLKPRLSLANSGINSGQAVESYAAILYDGRYFIAQIDHTGQFAFVPLDGFDGVIPGYGMDTITGDSWHCPAFEGLGLDSTYVSYSSENSIHPGDVIFYFAIAPAGDLSRIRGAAFKFTPSSP